MKTVYVVILGEVYRIGCYRGSKALKKAYGLHHNVGEV